MSVANGRERSERNTRALARLNACQGVLFLVSFNLVPVPVTRELSPTGGTRTNNKDKYQLMLIDWITARLPESFIAPITWGSLSEIGDRVIRLDAQTGDVKYMVQAWDSVRSDSHQVTIRLGSDALWIQGSPARVMGSGCSVFGDENAAKLDIYTCLQSMIGFLEKQLNLSLAPAPAWLVSRLDITENLLLPSLADVRSALSMLRGCEGGRYRVSSTAGDTVYWSQKSRLRKGKAYAKGPHLKYLNKKPDYLIRYTDNQLKAAEKLLRLELTLGSQWFRRNCPGGSWEEITSYQLADEWEKYFSRMIGTTEIVDQQTLITRLQAVAPTPGRAKAALSTWSLIQAYGWETARELNTKTTWYRNLQLLHAAGLGDADISAGNIVAFRQRVFECQAIHSWDELLAA